MIPGHGSALGAAELTNEGRCSVTESLRIKWVKEGDRWIAGKSEKDFWYEVRRIGEGWDCRMMFGEHFAAVIEARTLEQAKRIAERHWETGVWIP
jgi:hypothetical protein